MPKANIRITIDLEKLEKEQRDSVDDCGDRLIERELTRLKNKRPPGWITVTEMLADDKQ